MVVLSNPGLFPTPPRDRHEAPTQFPRRGFAFSRISAFSPPHPGTGTRPPHRIHTAPCPYGFPPQFLRRGFAFSRISAFSPPHPGTGTRPPHRIHTAPCPYGFPSNSSEEVLLFR